MRGFLLVRGRTLSAWVFYGVTGDHKDVLVVELPWVLYIVLLLGKLNVIWQGLVQLRHQNIGEVNHTLVQKQSHVGLARFEDGLKLLTLPVIAILGSLIANVINDLLEAIILRLSLGQ